MASSPRVTFEIGESFTLLVILKHIEGEVV